MFVRGLIAMVIIALTTAIAVPAVLTLQGVNGIDRAPATYVSPNDEMRLPSCSTGATPCIVP